MNTKTDAGIENKDNDHALWKMQDPFFLRGILKNNEFMIVYAPF